MYSVNMTLEKLFARCSVDQRTVLGFPSPGAEWWTPELLEAVRRRYECLGMDIEPYRAALKTQAQPPSSSSSPVARILVGSIAALAVLALVLK